MNTPDAKVEAIVTAARGLPAAQRSAYLDAVCRESHSLREQVEALLREKESADDESTVTLRVPGGALAPALPSEERPGTQIGRYKLLQQIGEGGMGFVWMAEQVEPVRRQVALKVIRPGMDSRQILARFEAERQALALMDHPNIAKVLDAGATPSGRPYFVMELVKGVPITKYCDEHQLPIPERLELFTQVCHAIQHAHQKGIIHRDIKPSNVMVAPYDGRPVPKVIDFGVAKATGQALTERTLFTEFGAVLGTPEYMSPEQAELNQLDVDTRSDIYSLGVLLYELLTGSTPLSRETLRQAAFDEILRRIREEEAPKPSTRLSQNRDTLLSISAQRKLEPAQLTRLLQGDLDWIVLKTLEKDRTRRYETANGLAMDIQRHLANEPVVARPPSAGYRLQKLVRRNKVTFAAAGFVLLAMVMGLGLSIWSLLEQRRARLEADRQRHQAELNEAKAQSEAEKSQQVAQFLKDMLGGVGPSVALGRDTTMLKEILEKTAKRVSEDLTSQPEVAAELDRIIGRVFSDIGSYGKAIATLHAALELQRAAVGMNDPVVAQTLRQLAEVQRVTGDNTQAVALLTQALTIQRSAFGSESAEAAITLRQLARSEHALNNADLAEANCHEALGMQRKLLGNDHEEVARTLCVLSEIQWRRHKLVEAEASAREAVAILSGIYPGGHPDLADSLGNLSMALKLQGKLAEAESARRENLAMRKKVLGNGHPWLFYSYAGLVDILVAENRLPEAESLAREAFTTRRERTGGGTDWELVHWLNCLSDVLGRQNKTLELKTLLQESVELVNAKTQNDFAWELATSLRPNFRDGPTAVEYALKAVNATGRTNLMYLDTLAAAYAEAGDFTNAVAVQNEVIALWPDSGAQTRLRLYQAGKPYHQMVPASPPP